MAQLYCMKLFSLFVFFTLPSMVSACSTGRTDGELMMYLIIFALAAVL